MNLKTYNTETLPARTAQPGVPSIGLYSRNGIFVFNDVARQHLDLRPGEQVQLLQDEDDPENWYLQATELCGCSITGKANRLRCSAIHTLKVARSGTTISGSPESPGRSLNN
jgi:hypothetical protein